MYSRKLFHAGVAVGALLLASPAVAQSTGQLYGAVAAGSATFFDEGGLEYDYLGYVLAGQVGMRMSPELRVEGEISYAASSAEIDGTSFDVDVTVIRPSISALYDFNGVGLGGMTPYLGAGVGIAFIDFDSGLGDDEELSAHFDAGAILDLGSFSFVPAARWELTDDASNLQLRAGILFGL